MPKFTVELPIAGSAFFEEVEAETKEQAIEKAFLMDATKAELSWETMTQISQGNVLYAPLNEPDATEVE